MKMVELSVILPVLNEQDNLIPIYDELVLVLNSLARPFEIIFIDDGSDDQSLERLKRIQAADPRVSVLEFRRNFGQTAALAAGLRSSTGDVVITMDADRQNDPADIPALLAAIGQGDDLVCGWRHKRQDGFWLRLLPSRIANYLISMTTEVKLHDYGCTLKAMRRDVADNLRLYGEMHRFIPAIANWYGVRMSEIKVNHRPRVAGVSKYGISRTVRVLLDLLTVKFLLGYSHRPIQFFGSIGLALSFAGSLILGWLAFERIFLGVPVGDRPLIFLGMVLLLAGLQFISVGLFAELQARTYHESQDKQIYEIRHVYRADEPNKPTVS
jgi:glycosyltransferase involved in cell wall biosynthesis